MKISVRTGPTAMATASGGRNNIGGRRQARASSPMRRLLSM
jgi:hypothetical protein